MVHGSVMKLMVRIAVAAAVLAGFFYLFLRTAQDARATPYIVASQHMQGWTLAVDESLELPEPAAMAVFRIFQEMLSNIGRHAQAGRVDIAIGVVQGVLSLRVQDDGVGAAPQAFEAPGSFGVRGMRCGHRPISLFQTAGSPFFAVGAAMAMRRAAGVAIRTRAAFAGQGARRSMRQSSS